MLGMFTGKKDAFGDWITEAVVTARSEAVLRMRGGRFTLAVRPLEHLVQLKDSSIAPNIRTKLEALLDGKDAVFVIKRVMRGKQFRPKLSAKLNRNQELKDLDFRTACFLTNPHSFGALLEVVESKGIAPITVNPSVETLEILEGQNRPGAAPVPSPSELTVDRLLEIRRAAIAELQRVDAQLDGFVGEEMARAEAVEYELEALAQEAMLEPLPTGPVEAPGAAPEPADALEAVEAVTQVAETIKATKKAKAKGKGKK